MIGEDTKCESVGIWKEVVVACFTKPHGHQFHSNPFFVPSQHPLEGGTDFIAPDCKAVVK